MFKVNEAEWDRLARAILGAVLLYLGLKGVEAGVLGVVLTIIGVLLLVTGLIGFCPVYALFKIKTKKS